MDRPAVAGIAVIWAGEGGAAHVLLSAAACVCSRTVLATTFEPAHDLGLSARLLFELDALVCASCVRVSVVRSVVLRPCATHFVL